MADNYHDKGGISPITAALVGAAVGAVAVALSNRETRKKLMKKLNELSDTVGERMDDMKTRAEELKKSGKARVARELEKARDRLTEEAG